MLALRRMSKAFGGVQTLAAEAKLNVNSRYPTLSSKGNPELKSLRAVLRAMGMQLTVQPLRKRVAWRDNSAMDRIKARSRVRQLVY